MKLIECPRDAMQGLAHFVPTDLKIRYLNALLTVGFDTLDFGSFVSPKAIPQLRDTAEVLAGLDLSTTKTKLLAIVANVRGAEQAVDHSQIQYVGFPLSVSETFQQRNTNKSIDQAFAEVAEMQNLCIQAGKDLVVYLSMGFGNPYGDVYSPNLVAEFTAQLVQLGVRIIAPSDTVGSSTPEAIENLFTQLIHKFPQIEFGAHLHARPGDAPAKVRSALRAGVQRIDGALRGFGGCPMAADSLTGNLPTEEIIQTLAAEGINLSLNQEAFQKALTLSAGVF
ncbi:hydroxymethylglutaryl-CoA lyase [Spirosoma pollinicola]|uniref:Hydroxymethylglutaryl-CoA lyase n=1 Tax=Spirosoma pollinicola TaxID=2057025 RepID=A0A2K8Z129_9BACT|nr:hydroxymethylglutaryl-CoA lyase [Spirosoma pollinicola]AUD03565.1 hydroxymethylglutaryl-CoA lyase [Spirosoma pollinicola]